MVELARYRREKGLGAFPVAGEATPLLLPIGERKQAMTRGAVHAIVKQVFATAARRCRLRGEAFESIAAHIE